MISQKGKPEREGGGEGGTALSSRLRSPDGYRPQGTNIATRHQAVQAPRQATSCAPQIR